MGFLETPPQEAVDLATELTERAVQAVEALYANDPNVPLALSGDIDVVVSGGGNYDAYYMGIAMVLERAATRWDLRLLCDDVVHAEADAWQCRLRGHGSHISG